MRIIRVGGWRCRKQEEQDRGKPYDANPHPFAPLNPSPAVRERTSRASDGGW